MCDPTERSRQRGRSFPLSRAARGNTTRYALLGTRTITETSCTPQTENEKVRSAYVSIRYISYDKRVATETEIEEAA